MKLKIFSFFSGSGFLDLGFELNGYSIELVNEFHPAFINAYKYSRKQMGLAVPKYGYSNININEYLEKRADELRGYIADAKKDGSFVGFIGGPLALIFLLPANSEAGTGTTVNCPCPIFS